MILQFTQTALCVLCIIGLNVRYTQTTNYKRVNNIYKPIPKRRNHFGKVTSLSEQ